MVMADDKLAEAYWHKQIDLQPTGVWTTADIQAAFLAGRASLTDAEVLRRAAEIVEANSWNDWPHGSIAGAAHNMRWLASRLAAETTDRLAVQSPKSPPASQLQEERLKAADEVVKIWESRTFVTDEADESYERLCDALSTLAVLAL